MQANSFLSRAIEVIEHDAPCSAEHAEGLLLKQKIVRSPMRAEGILATARALAVDIRWQINELNSSKMIFGPGDAEAIKNFHHEARRRIRHFGVTKKEHVLANLGCQRTSNFADLCCSLAEDLIWLDEGNDWFWLPTACNPLTSRLAKILRVVPRLDLKVALKGVVRDRHMQGTELPIDIFRVFCNLMPWCQADEQQVFATRELPEEDEQDSDEILICRILKDNGHVMWRHDLWRLANNAGVERDSFGRQLSDSNVLVRLAREVYGLIGSNGMPAPLAQSSSHMVEILQPSVTQ